MNIRYYGTRGSLPTPGKATNIYGGNTTCLSIVSNEKQYIIDGGSGLRLLGNDLMQKEFKQGQGEVVFFWTHYHWDHIMGFPFFVPNFIPGNRIIHYGASPTREVLTRQQDFINFPIEFSKMPSEHIFHTILPGETINLDGLEVCSCRMSHPAGGFIFRFSYQGKSFVFATDTEHPEQGRDEQLLALSSGVDLLIYDAQYTPDEYQRRHKGWGHSTWEKAVDLAKAAGVKRLHLCHHDQVHSDEFLEEKILKPARALFPATDLAKEGWEFII